MAIMDILSKYWWVLAILVLGLIIWGWSQLNVYTRIKLRKFFSGKTLILFLVVIGWWSWYKFGDMMEIKTANLWMPIIILLFLVGLNFIGKLRYDTRNQFKSPNFHGSYSVAPYRLNGYLIFAIDSFNAGGFSWDYASRIIVIREETCELFDFGAVSIARTGQVSKYELPEEILQFINSNKFLKKATEQVYYGWFDDLNQVDWDFKQLNNLEETKKEKGIYTLLKKELEVDNPKVSTLFWNFRNQSKSLNKQTEWYDATVESTEKGVEHQKRVKDAYVDKPEKIHKHEGYEGEY